MIDTDEEARKSFVESTLEKKVEGKKKEVKEKEPSVPSFTKWLMELEESADLVVSEIVGLIIRPWFHCPEH